MNHALFSGTVMACLAGLAPMVVEAQDFGPTVPINCTITRPRPVYTTQLHSQNVTVFRDVAETQITHQRVVENIPITTCQNVTVDEGGYQMVWVSKPVTKQVARTVVQQQVKMVDVPVQVRRRIPETATRMVPVQTVRYVNETVPIQMTGMASACSTCGNGIAMGSPMPSMGLPVYSPPSVYPQARYQTPQNSTAAIPTMPAIDLPSYQNSNRSILGAESASPMPGLSEETVRARGVPSPQDDLIPRPRKTSMFQGVPSSAFVWRRQDSSYLR